MSQMPNEIWLHKDTKYNTGNIVCGYQYEFAEEIEDEGGIENFVEYVRKDAFIEKACDFIRTNAEKHIYFDKGNSEWYDSEEFVEDFKNYIEGE